jgi:hypothetical protein
MGFFVGRHFWGFGLLGGGFGGYIGILLFVFFLFEDGLGEKSVKWLGRILHFSVFYLFLGFGGYRFIRIKYK